MEELRKALQDMIWLAEGLNEDEKKFEKK